MANLILPVTLDGDRITISQRYGADFAWKGFDQYYRQYYGLNGHNGIDCGGWGIDGEPVMASGDGVVEYAGRGDDWDSTVGGGSFTVVIHHPHLGVWTAYLHLRNNSSTVVAGQKVKQGQMIARAGNTGIGTGAHLHFQVMPVAPRPLVYQPNWGCVNPAPYMSTATAAAGGTITPIKEDELSAAEVKEIKDYIDRKFNDAPRNVWAYDQGGKTPQAWHFQKNVGSVVWAHRLKNRAGKVYSAAANLTNNNVNIWDILGYVKSIATALVKKSDIDAAVAEVNAHTTDAMVDAAIEVEVTVKGQEKV